MRHGTVDGDQPAFNNIRIDLRGSDFTNLNKTRPSYGNHYLNENDQRSQASVPSRISRYAGK